jgi:hypothetical protein
LTRGDRATGVALAAALTGVLSHGVGAATAPTPEPRPPATTGREATWTPHSITIAYQGLTTHYSCEGFKDKMGALLRWFGARPDSIRLRTYGCAGGPYRASPAINLAMEFETLAPSPTGGASAVRGAWLERDLFGDTRISRAAPSHIERGDCELVQKFVASVLPSFTHEILKNLTRCIPKELSGSVPNLRVRVFVPEKTSEPRAEPAPTAPRPTARRDGAVFLTYRPDADTAVLEDDSWHARQWFEAL